jgi:hypothetical protein
MAQGADNRILYPTESAAVAPFSANGVAETPAIALAGPPENSTNDIANEKVTATQPGSPPYFHEALEDAERLLKYAAEIGIDVDADTRDHILQARAASGGVGWNEGTVANLLAALTKLAASLKPVTAESLKACTDDTRPTVRSYWLVAICLAIVIVPFSLASFVSSAISNAIRADITTANDLAVQLRAELGTAAAPSAGTPTKPELPKGLNEADVISQLQLYASTIRAIDARSRQLNGFVFDAERDPFAEYRWDPKKSDQEKAADEAKIKDLFQLPVGLTNMPQALDTLTTTYQDVRLFGQDILDLISVYYGAITTCLLPVLYALLGTCAYLLRTFEQQMAARTFIPSIANSARFLIAAIGGAVVGLFNNFTITQGASIPPLAIAFLVGYAVDVFFSFLEGLLQAFTKNKDSTSSPQPAAVAH